MSRLIALSNRVKLPDNGPMAGGLAVALNDVLKGRSVIWMGWNGDIDDTDNNRVNNRDSNEFSQQERTVKSSDTDIQKTSSTITYVTTALTSKQYQHYYCGFANSVLWPLMHEQPSLISQAPEDYAGYQVVNRLFAKALKTIAEPDDVIWVHDYHFLSVAYHCRQLGMSNRIGLFLHIPFAPLDLWQDLDNSTELIHHLARYDVVGTQTEQDKANCFSVCQHYLKEHLLDNPSVAPNANKQSFTKLEQYKHSDSTQLTLNLDLDAAHSLTIKDYPIGVNVARIQQQVSGLSSPLSVAKNVQKDTIKPTTQQIIAVDRIDYSKGLLERFSAYRTFLQQNPQYQNQLKFLQIACPSRLDLPVYQQLYNEVRQAVNEVNEQFTPTKSAQYCSNGLYEATGEAHNFKANRVRGDSIITNSITADTCQDDDVIDSCKNGINDVKTDWQAITYSENVLGHEKLMTAFHYSDIGWVNSLKDGMNLVAKEYIAAQNPDNPGVLLLSRYAGAAAQMQAAVIIDPQQPISIIQGLKTALTMPLAERQERYQTLMQGLTAYDIHTWQHSFLEDLYSSRQSNGE